MNDIEAAFHQYFEIVIADTPELLKIVFNLRFQILCVHNAIPGFNTANYLNEQESDEYDNRSIQLLLRHRPSETFIGTARLVLPNMQNPENKFPVEAYSQFFSGFTLSAASRQHTAEISRFLILSDFFRRKSEQGMLPVATNIKENTVQERRRFPHPMLGLAIGIIRLCHKHKIYHWLSAMNPTLNRLLGFYSMQLNPVGPLIYHHGFRSPYYVCLFDVLDRMHRNHREIWELATDYGKIWPAELSAQHKSELQPAHPDNAYASR